MARARRHLVAPAATAGRRQSAQELAIILLWALLVTVVTDAVLNIKCVSTARLNVKLNLDHGMPSIDFRKPESSSYIETTLSIESRASSPVGPSIHLKNNRERLVKKLNPINKINNVPSEVYIPLHRDLTSERHQADEHLENNKYMAMNVEEPKKRNDDKVPDIAPYVEMFEKIRAAENKERDPSEGYPVTSMDLISKKRSQTKKSHIKHVLKVTNDPIQPEVQSIKIPVRNTKRAAGLSSKSVSFSIDPTKNDKSSENNIPKVDYNMKDIFYAVNPRSIKPKRQDPVLETKNILKDENITAVSDVVLDTPNNANSEVTEVTQSYLSESVVDTITETSNSINISSYSENDSSLSPKEGPRSTDPHAAAPSLGDVSFDPNNVPSIALGQFDTVR